MTSQVEPEAVASSSLNVYDYDTDTDDGGNPSDEVAKSENVSASDAVAVKKESEYDYDTDDGDGGGKPAALSTSATSMSNTETLAENNDGSDIKLKRPLSEISSGLTWGWGIPPLVKPPSRLPQADSLLEFDVNQKKNDIFEAVRERVRSKAQYTKSVSFLYFDLTLVREAWSSCLNCIAIYVFTGKETLDPNHSNTSN